MGLIDLKTDLKSLKYSKDRIGGGSSNQPFVQKPIPDGFSAVGNTGGLDVLTRGGSLVFQKTADDVSRLSKLLLTANTFQGPAFTIKQNVLSRQNVQTQASPKGLNQGAYIPTSTIAQATVNATGLHFNTFGLNPVPGTLRSLTTYSDVVSYDQPTSANRLIGLTDSFVSRKTLGNTLYSYSGGPGSILGLGKTKIQIPIEQRTGKNSINSNTKQIVKYVNLIHPEFLTPASDKAGLGETETGIYYSQKLGKFTVGIDFGAENSIDVLTTQKFADTTSTGTIKAVIPEAQSFYAAQNFPDVTLYKLGGISNLDSLLGATVSASLSPAFPGTSPTTNNLVTLDTLRINSGLGTKLNINLNENSSYATTNNLTGSLYIPVTGSTSNSGSVPTDFRRVSQPTLTADQDNVKNLDNLTAFSYTAAELKTAPSYRTDTKLTDFRKTLRSSLKNGTLAQGKLIGALIDAPDYATVNIEQRVYLGNPADPLRDLSSYTAGTGLGAVDKINALPLYKSAKVAGDDTLPVNDLVKFRIAIVGTDGQKVFIHFRAFLDSVSDNYSADWQSHKYVGRGENFYTYGGFDRKISLSWTVYAQSKEELIPMYQKLNYLASSLAPRYNGGFMQGTLAELTVGGYVHDQPGIITGLTYELSEQSTWDIGIDDAGGSDDRVKELPHMIKVTGFNFTPIHTFIPERQQNAYSGANGKVSSFGQERYIGLKAVTSNYDTDVSPSLARNNTTKPNWGTDAEWDAYNKERIRTNDPAFQNTQ